MSSNILLDQNFDANDVSIMVFETKKRVLAHLTSFLLKNAFKRWEMLVLGLVSLILHNSMRLHVSQCFHCIKTDNVQKTHF